MNTHRYLFALWFSMVTSQAPGAAVKDREGAVRQDKAAMENDARWTYNDIDRAFLEARRSGKPLLVVLRCVPCLSCAGIDAGVLTEPQLAPLLDRFVCVRVINANALDLSVFQFDYDLSLSALILNGDRTVYGRFGSWRHQKDEKDKSTAAFRQALEAALALHQQYPANKAALAGKQGLVIPFKTPVDIPTLSGKYRLDLDWNGKVVPSCVHCHQIGDALRLDHRARSEPMPSDLIYPMPPPEAIGLVLAPDVIARVESVREGSPAARAGVRKGDEIIGLGGQPLISAADLSWALHRAPETGMLSMEVSRAGSREELSLPLAARWREKSDISGRVGTWGLRGMATGGLVLEDLTDESRTTRGLHGDKLALRVKYVGEYGKHAAGKKAGFQKDDVIIAMGGYSGRLTEGEVIGRLLQDHRVGESVKATVMRGQERLELALPMQ